MDLFPRAVTDILWTSNPGVRSWAKGDVRKIYYAALVIFVIWGCIAINLAQPFILIILGAFMAGLRWRSTASTSGTSTVRSCRRSSRPPAWRQIALLVFSGFFAFFTLVVILNRVFGIKIG